MEIDIETLAACEVAADGDAISLGFVDSAGQPATVTLSLNDAGSLAMTLPGLIAKRCRHALTTEACIMPTRWHPGLSSSRPIPRKSW
jgi:hypothetical protein